MKLSSPLITLAAGAVVALALFGASSLAAKPAAAPAAPAPSPSASPSAYPSTAAAAAPASPAAQAAKVTAVWAGRTDGGAASIAIAVKNGVAVAYVCDGKREIWLQGTADDGKLALSGAKGAALVGTFGGGKATGRVTSGSAEYTFTVAAVSKPSGLYRAAAQVRNAKVVGGWIVLPDGSQVGVLDRDGVASDAPPIDPATGAVTVDGTALTASYVEGSNIDGVTP